MTFYRFARVIYIYIKPRSSCVTVVISFKLRGGARRGVGGWLGWGGKYRLVWSGLPLLAARGGVPALLSCPLVQTVALFVAVVVVGQRRKFDVFCLSALSQENELIFARQRAKNKLGTCSAKIEVLRI